MKRIVAGMVVILMALIAVPPAEAQTGSPWWTQGSPPRESDGEVLVGLQFGRAGRIRYRTYDGNCDPAPLPPSDPAPCGAPARAPEDYTAVDSEVVFTGAGSEVIRIPIVDDGVAEGSEEFTIEAWEEPNADWPLARYREIVRIIDDDVIDDSAVATPATPGPRSQSSSSVPVLTVSPTPAPTGDLPVADLPAEPVSPTLEPGPGFELRGERASGPAPVRRDGDGASSSWLLPGLGTAAAGVSAVAILRRRKQWSPIRQ